MAEATALFGMPGSTVLAAARVAGEREVLIETAQECQARRQGGGFRGNNGGVRATSEGICAGHGVVPGGEGSASDLDYAGKPRESPPNKLRAVQPTPSTTRWTRPRKLPRFVPLSSRTLAAKTRRGKRFFHGCSQDGQPSRTLGAGPFSAGRGRG